MSEHQDRRGGGVMSVGDVVVLVSGGPPMTVTDINYQGMDGTLVTCMWAKSAPDGGWAGMERETFPLVCLALDARAHESVQ